MSRWLDFSNRQIKFIGFLSATVTIMGLYLFVRLYSEPTRTGSGLEIFVSENTQVFTGIFIIDPNTAPADSLELLPGIGKVIADRIVEYRKDHVFEREVDITDVNGIGPKMFERLRPYLKVKQQ